MESNFKNYTNQYSSSTLALNKHQHNEERDKKRFLSHKFSLTPISDFKWNGSCHGRKAVMLQTLIMTIINLESNLPTALLHPNWPLHRQSWANALQMCRTPSDFGLALSILESCMKPVIFNPVWTEALGKVFTLIHLWKTYKRQLTRLVVGYWISLGTPLCSTN